MWVQVVVFEKELDADELAFAGHDPIQADKHLCHVMGTILLCCARVCCNHPARPKDGITVIPPPSSPSPSPPTQQH